MLLAIRKSEYDAYCTSMGTKAVWGGECELKAISSILKRPIRVFQSAGGVRHLVLLLFLFLCFGNQQRPLEMDSPRVCR